MTDRQRFNELRKFTFDKIRWQLEQDPCCKSYEGTFEVLVSYPDYFEDNLANKKPDHYKITLHCYVLGPKRHYEWTGKTFKEALDKAEKQIEEF